jgi:hypothetical protein
MNPRQPDLIPDRQGGGAGPATPTHFQTVVQDAIARLDHNTPEARRDAYARVREVVFRHLDLSGMPKTFADLERLAFDLAIRNVEQQWRARESAEAAVERKSYGPPSRAADPQPVSARPARTALKL